jgi:hypothetical protein
MSNTAKINIEQIAKRYTVIIQKTTGALAMDYETPAQRTINRAFEEMGIARFRGKDDVWEMLMAHRDGTEYNRPPAHLMRRWECY